MTFFKKQAGKQILVLIDVKIVYIIFVGDKRTNKKEKKTDN